MKYILFEGLTYVDICGKQTTGKLQANYKQKGSKL